MTIKLTSAIRNSRASVISDAMELGATVSGAILKIYTNPAPAGIDNVVPPTASLLVTLVFPTSVVASLSGGVLNLNTPPTANAVDDGIATWARLTNHDGTVTIMDLSVSTTAGSGDIKLNSTDIINGGPVSVVSASITEGNAG